MKVEYGKTGTYFYLVGLILIGIFLPTSKFGLSVSQFYLLALWMLLGLDMRSINKMYTEKPFISRILYRIAFSFNGIWSIIKTRFNDFIHNKIAVVMVSMYLMHFIGLIYTSDFQYAFKDLRIKLPLLVFPLILSSMKPLNRKQFDTVLWFFISSVFFVTILAAIKFFRRDFVDVRELSVFVSHIRFSLCIVFSIFILGYYFLKRNYRPLVKMIIIFMILWMLWQIMILESFIGILIIFALCVTLTLYFIFKSKNITAKISSVVVIVIIVFLLIYYPHKVIRDYLLCHLSSMVLSYCYHTHLKKKRIPNAPPHCDDKPPRCYRNRLYYSQYRDLDWLWSSVHLPVQPSLQPPEVYIAQKEFQ